MKSPRLASFAPSFVFLLAPAAAALAVVLVAGPAAAHSRIKTPPAITQDDNAKSGPCGCYFGDGPQDPNDDPSPSACPADFPVTTLQAGTELTFAWQETVNHNGSFRIAFSAKAPKDVTKGDMDGGAMMEIPDDNATSGATLTQKITVPSEPCELCTLQLRQLMVGAAQPYYYSCAAVKIVAADPTTSGSTTSSTGSGGGNGGAGGAAAGGSGLGGDGGAGGAVPTTGAGMASPQPAVQSGCSTSRGRTSGEGGALAIVGLSLAAGLLRRRRSAALR